MSHKHPMPSKNELENIYHSVKSISKTARHFNTSNPTVRKWLIEYGILRYTQKEANSHVFFMRRIEIPSKEELEFLYRTMSIIDILQLYNIGQNCFYDWLKHHNIEKIEHGQKVSIIKQKKFLERFDLNKEQIESDYKRLGCMRALAIEYKCSMTTIKKLFKMYNVEAIFAKTSVGQTEVARFIESLGFTASLNDRETISPLELDIVVIDKNLAIEYCGNFYHSETWGNKTKDYHLKKFLKCRDVGIDLITIFDSEWQTKRDIIKSIISHKLGKVETKIYARNTVFKQLTYKDVKEFETENHLQGSRPAEKYFGLFHNHELVMSISFGKSRYNKKYQYEIIRMTTKKNTSVVGGASKLFKNSGITNCITYADNRFGSGKTYEKIGMRKIHESAPNYFYFHKTDHYTMYSRAKFQKHKIPNVDMSKSEYENMLDQGYDRIWDCGNTVYVYVSLNTMQSKQQSITI